MLSNKLYKFSQLTLLLLFFFQGQTAQAGVVDSTTIGGSPKYKPGQPTLKFTDETVQPSQQPYGSFATSNELQIQTDDKSNLLEGLAANPIVQNTEYQYSQMDVVKGTITVAASS